MPGCHCHGLLVESMRLSRLKRWIWMFCPRLAPYQICFESPFFWFLVAISWNWVTWSRIMSWFVECVDKRVAARVWNSCVPYKWHRSFVHKSLLQSLQRLRLRHTKQILAKRVCQLVEKCRSVSRSWCPVWQREIVALFCHQMMKRPMAWTEPAPTIAWHV